MNILKDGERSRAFPSLLRKDLPTRYIRGYLADACLMFLPYLFKVSCFSDPGECPLFCRARANTYFEAFLGGRYRAQSLIPGFPRPNQRVRVSKREMRRKNEDGSFLSLVFFSFHCLLSQMKERSENGLLFPR